jgi:hypothetical protein
VQVRTQTYAIRISDSQNLVLENLNFFASTVWAGALAAGREDQEDDEGQGGGDVQGIVFQSLQFEYPHAQQVKGLLMFVQCDLSSS